MTQTTTTPDIASAAHSDQTRLHASSIDPAEQSFYAGLADTWWDTGGPFWPLHKLNDVRVAYIRDALCRRYGRDAASDAPLQGLSVLDIGCGGGILAAAMARLGAEVHGIDVVERNVAVARHHADSNGLNVRYDAVSAEWLSTQRRRYDVVLCMEVVEHVADLDGFLGACCALLADGGTLFVATLNRTFRSWLFGIVGAEYVLGWLPRGTHQWRRFRRPAEVENVLARNGVRTTSRSGVSVNPLTRHFRLTGNLAVNYMLMAVTATDSGA